MNKTDINSCCDNGQSNEAIEKEVLRRYKAGAQSVQEDLCCPTSYDGRYLKILPKEIIEKDYGCGDPSEYVGCGETVLDLGSGTGKICYILSQKVGANGSVIGVDFNDEMLKLAEKYHRQISEKIGYDNVEFKKGKIQDLKLDLYKLDQWIRSNPVRTVDQLLDLDEQCERLRNEQILIADNSIDVVVSNCVLNLVKPQDKETLFREIFRVLKAGGRAVISDIVSNTDLPESILNDPELWSGCIAGAFREDLFGGLFENAGFENIEVLKRQEKPWKVIQTIEFRSVTIRAYKPE